MACKATEAELDSRSSAAASAQIAHVAADLLRGVAYQDKLTFSFKPEGNNQVIVTAGDSSAQQKFSVSGQSCKTILSMSPKASGQGLIETPAASFSGVAPEFTFADALKNGVKANGAMKGADAKPIFTADAHCNLAGNTLTGLLAGEVKASCDAKLSAGDGKTAAALNFQITASGGNKDIVVLKEGKELLVAKYLKGLNGAGSLEISIKDAQKAN